MLFVPAFPGLLPVQGHTVCVCVCVCVLGSLWLLSDAPSVHTEG